MRVVVIAQLAWLLANALCGARRAAAALLFCCVTSAALAAPVEGKLKLAVLAGYGLDLKKHELRMNGILIYVLRNLANSVGAQYVTENYLRSLTGLQAVDVLDIEKVFSGGNFTHVLVARVVPTNSSLDVLEVETAPLENGRPLAPETIAIQLRTNAGNGYLDAVSVGLMLHIRAKYRREDDVRHVHVGCILPKSDDGRWVTKFEPRLAKMIMYQLSDIYEREALKDLRYRPVWRKTDYEIELGDRQFKCKTPSHEIQDIAAKSDFNVSGHVWVTSTTTRHSFKLGIEVVRNLPQHDKIKIEIGLPEIADRKLRDDATILNQVSEEWFPIKFECEWMMRVENQERKPCPADAQTLMR